MALLLWYLRKTHKITVTLAVAITGLGTASIVILDGVVAGVSWSASAIVGAIVGALMAVAMGAYLAIWRSRGGTIDGWRMPW